MLEREFKFYLKNQSDFVLKHNGKFIVLKDQKVIGVYNSNHEAYAETTKTEKLGTFLIQHCLPGKEGYSQTFNSQVIIHKRA